MHFPANDEPLILNGFEVDPRLAALMRRPDWAGEHQSQAWLERFPVHPLADRSHVPFVHFFDVDTSSYQNEIIHLPDRRILWGQPSNEYPPGDLDLTAGYLLGWVYPTEFYIAVDLRPSAGPRILSEMIGPKDAIYTTTFSDLEEFVDFYIAQHGI
jgi:hypothetical protein